MLQHYVKNLGDRAVAYLNVDLAFEGNISLRARALPILRDFVYNVAKRVISIVVSSSMHTHIHIHELCAFHVFETQEHQLSQTDCASDIAVNLTNGDVPSWSLVRSC